MTSHEKLRQELEQAPDDLVQMMLDLLYRVKATRQMHPFQKFIGILNDTEAAELQQAIATECRQVDANKW